MQPNSRKRRGERYEHLNFIESFSKAHIEKNFWCYKYSACVANGPNDELKR